MLLSTSDRELLGRLLTDPTLDVSCIEAAFLPSLSPQLILFDDVASHPSTFSILDALAPRSYYLCFSTVLSSTLNKIRLPWAGPNPVAHHHDRSHLLPAPASKSITNPTFDPPHKEAHDGRLKHEYSFSLPF